MLVLLHVHYPESVTGRQRAGLGVAGRPGGHHQATALGPRLELLDHVADLVVKRRLPIFMDGKVAPEVAVGARHQSVVVSPGFPELAAVLAQKINARVPGQKPEIFNDDIFPRDLFGGQQRKAFPEINLVVHIEDRQGVDTGAVCLPLAGLKHPLDDVKILLQQCTPLGSRGP